MPTEIKTPVFTPDDASDIALALLQRRPIFMPIDDPRSPHNYLYCQASTTLFTKHLDPASFERICAEAIKCNEQELRETFADSGWADDHIPVGFCYNVFTCDENGKRAIDLCTNMPVAAIGVKLMVRLYAKPR